MTRKPATAAFICIGALAGVFTIFSFPALIAVGLSICVVQNCRKYAQDDSEKKFITYVCIAAIGIRIFISACILAYGKYSGAGSDVFGDALSYEGVGAYIMELIRGVPIEKGIWGDNLLAVIWLRKIWDVFSSNAAGTYTIPYVSYWYGYLDSLWGLSYLAPKILNGLFWIMGLFWLYIFFRERFINANLKWGLMIGLFLPSLLIFSSSGLKDSLLFFLVVSIIFSSHKLEHSNHRRYAFFALSAAPVIGKLISHIGMLQTSFLLISIFIISVIMVVYNNAFWPFWGTLIISSGLLLPSFRAYISYFVFLYALSLLIRKFPIAKICIGILTLTLIASFVLKTNFLANVSGRLKVQVQRRISESVLQSFNTAYGNTAYHIYPEKYYANIETRETITFLQVIVSYLNGLRYVFLEPTIFSFKSPLAVLMLPEVLFMWIFMPFIILGSIVILRINTHTALFTILFLLAITSLLALGQGNMGTLIRTRCMIMPWYFMIGVLGVNSAFVYFLKQKTNRSD